MWGHLTRLLHTGWASATAHACVTQRSGQRVALREARNVDVEAAQEHCFSGDVRLQGHQGGRGQPVDSFPHVPRFFCLCFFEHFPRLFARTSERTLKSITRLSASPRVAQLQLAALSIHCKEPVSLM